MLQLWLYGRDLLVHPQLGIEPKPTQILKRIVVDVLEFIGQRYFLFFFLIQIILKPDHKNKKPRHVAENPWN
jgi:hypothetical protein